MTRAAGTPPGTVRVASVGGVPVLVSASCLVVVALLAVAFAPRAEDVVPGLGTWAYATGALVGVLVYVAALVHECAHAAVARRYGHRVSSVALSVTGGRTSVEGEARTPGEEFTTAVVGPLASLALGLAALGGRLVVDDGVLALALEALVVANLVLGLLDLVPAPPLDGGRMVKALAWRIVGSPRRGALAAAWGGRVTAVLLLLAPALRQPLLGTPPGLSDFLVCGALALLLWTVATQEIAVNRMRLRLGDVVLADLARPALTVPPDLPLAEALRRAAEIDAGGIVTVDATGRPLGLVPDAGVESTPAERRPWVATAALAEPLDDGLCLAVDVSGDALLSAVQRRPAAAYLLLDAGGGLRGVLALRDLDRLVRPGASGRAGAR
ncbi:site-2 protease family protein [Nocardioides dongxiaopingii]|uniref:site-2 protease family protein n=1 Tax=Nocardioides sp. S-1144 TaxID=2582905 RepID=UPI00110E0B4F|nr:site-2 protease family protein [Nocardioides sp. S-1144]QCW50714.1 site-2 protease family protein [Nocardioides sp. S-1144]